MKHKLQLSLIALIIMFTSINVNASTGSATVEFNGKNTLNVGEVFIVRMDVKDIIDTNNGVVSLEGNLSFDENMIEYISSKTSDAPYQFYINENYNYKIAGLDFTLNNGINYNTTIYEFSFKALNSGDTTITLNNAKLTDSVNRISSNILSKTITINEIEENNGLEESNEIVELTYNDTIINEEKEATKNIIKNEIKEITLEKEEVKQENITTKISEMIKKVTIEFEHFFN